MDDLFDCGYSVSDRVEAAVELLRDFEPKNGAYTLLYSGGKDSDVILQLAREAGVRFRAVHNLTTIDPPEVVYHVRQVGVEIRRPERNFFTTGELLGKFPTRRQRWCCELYKERQNEHGARMIMGVRAEEAAPGAHVVACHSAQRHGAIRRLADPALVERRRVGVHPRPGPALLQALRRGLRAPGVHRLPDGPQAAACAAVPALAALRTAVAAHVPAHLGAQERETGRPWQRVVWRPAFRDVGADVGVVAERRPTPDTTRMCGMLDLLA